MTMIQFWPNLTAGGDINPGRFVVMSSTPWRATESDASATAAIVGVSGLDAASGVVTDNVGDTLENPLHASAGDGIRLQSGGVLTVEAGAAVTAGALIQSDATGRVITLAAGTNVGIALETSVAAGEFIKIHWQPRG